MFDARVVRSSRRHVLFALAALVTAATLACTRIAPTQPRDLARRPFARRPIEGDTTQCRSGWTVQGGRYVCLT